MDPPFAPKYQINDSGGPFASKYQTKDIGEELGVHLPLNIKEREKQ